MKYWKAYRLEQVLRHRRDGTLRQQATVEGDLRSLVAVAEDITSFTPPAPDAHFVDQLALLLAATAPAPPAPRRQLMLPSLTWRRVTLATTMVAIICLGILGPRGSVAQLFRSAPPVAITSADAKDRVAVAFAALGQPQLSQTQQLALVNAYRAEVQVVLRILPPSELPTWTDRQRQQIVALEGRLDATLIAMLLEPLPTGLAATLTPTASTPPLPTVTLEVGVATVVVSSPTPSPGHVVRPLTPVPTAAVVEQTATPSLGGAKERVGHPAAAVPRPVQSPQLAGPPAVSRPAPTRTPLRAIPAPDAAATSAPTPPPVHDVADTPPVASTTPTASESAPTVPAAPPATPSAPDEPMRTATPAGEPTTPSRPASAPAPIPEAPTAPSTQAPTVLPTQAPTAPTVPAETMMPEAPVVMGTPPPAPPTTAPEAPPRPEPSGTVDGTQAPEAPTTRAARQP